MSTPYTQSDTCEHPHLQADFGFVYCIQCRKILRDSRGEDIKVDAWYHDGSSNLEQDA